MGIRVDGLKAGVIPHGKTNWIIMKAVIAALGNKTTAQYGKKKSLSTSLPGQRQ
jgi:hypothetical protein